jgi:hypothetical protein
MSGPIPDWLRELLIQSGQLTSDGYTRRARTRFCRKCGATIVSGLDGDAVAGRVDVDVTCLDNEQELEALLAGRPTFRIAWRGRYEINHRDQWQIARQPASKVGGVHAEHRCGAVLGSLAGPPTPRAVQTTYPVIPPF